MAAEFRLGRLFTKEEKVSRGKSIVLCSLLLQAACARTPTPVWHVLFGPVVGQEPIGGRVEDSGQRIVLLTNGNALVLIDLGSRAASRVPLAVGAAHCWGLARLSDGSVWTVENRRTLAEIDLTGRIVKQIALAGPHLDLFSIGSTLLYEETGISLPAPVLRAGPPGPGGTSQWSDLMMRPFPDFTPGVRMALNVVNCGTGHQGALPCWFPDEAAVALIDTDGRTRRVELSGLYRVSPEALVASDAPPRPIRDVFVDERDIMWVLSSGRPPDRSTDRPGGWVLARYSLGGHAIDQRRLPEPVRAILRVENGRAIVLTGEGMVAEIIP